MRFWWPDWEPRERSLSTDSECSTASHSSLGSDASFYSAAAAEADVAADGYIPHGYGHLGVRLHTDALVLSSSELQIGPVEPPRAVPLLGTGGFSAATTSGTGSGPAAPIVRQPGPLDATSGGQASTRPAASVPRRFGDPPDGGRPAGRPAVAGGPPSLGPTIGGSQASQASPPPPATKEHSATSAAAEDGARSDGPPGASRPPPDLQARRTAAQDASPPRPVRAAAPDPSCDERQPVRAAGRLPDRVALGAALAAATARALALPTDPHDLDTDDSDDEDGQDDHAAAVSGPQDSLTVAALPVRAGGMLPDPGAPSTASSATPPSPAAVATAPSVVAAAADRAAPPADRAAAEHRARAEPSHDQEFLASARAETMTGDAISSWNSTSSTAVHRDDSDGGRDDDEARAVAAVPMGVDQGTWWPTTGPQPLSPPPVLRVGDKRRRLNDADDEDSRELAELLLLEEDEAGNRHPAPRPSAASARPASVLTVYAHNAQRFECTLCTYTAASFAALKRHRDSRHRRVAFLDKFSAGCACGTPFASRLAAARHTQACASPSTTSATAPTAAGASSHTTAGASATVAAAATTMPDLPPRTTSELTASPPLVSPTDVAAQESGAATRTNRWNPPLPRMMVASRIAGRLSRIPPPRWDPPLPRGLVTSRIAARLSEAPAPRWGPPLPRSIVVSRIADRLLPPSPDRWTLDEETKESDTTDATMHAADMEPTDDVQVETEAPTSEPPTATPREWRLQFDGACRNGPNPGGAGALLFDPDGAVVWTGSRYMPGTTETNNTAEYTALLIGARAAADHGVKRLRVEGDSLLVIRQVKGLYGTKSTRLRQLRNAVRQELTRLEQHSLHHIDRQGNAFADRLANRALDRKNTKVECKAHPEPGACTTSMDNGPAPAVTAAAAVPPMGTCDADTAAAANDMDQRADIDDGEVYAPLHVGPDEVPARRPRLRLRQLTEEEYEAACETVERLGAALSAKITDASDWETAEGYITALPYTLYDKLQPYCQQRGSPTQSQQRPQQQRDGQHQQQQRNTTADLDTQEPEQEEGQRRRRRRRGRRKSRRSRRHPRQSGGSGGGTRQKQQRQPRPPRVTRHHREHRIDEALDELHALERVRPQDRSAIAKARRRVGRIRSAINQHLLRHRFDTDEKTCVGNILEKARAERAAHAARTTAAMATEEASDATTPVDDGVCPIPSDELWRHFTAVNTPPTDFDAEAPDGAAFRTAMARLPAATRFRELLTEAPTADEIETQLEHVRGASSPGLDGVGYDVYKRFSAQLLPVLTAACKRCWDAKRAPQSWKLGVVRLLHKKGSREDPANWRPICLQQAVYKLYTGVLARRLTRWMDANERHAPGQKGFRAVNGCGEHNFLAATLVDHARRKRRSLYEVWYDLRNAFGSVPFRLLWDALHRLGIPAGYVAMCQGLYDQAAFVVGNAADGQTAPIWQRVGVFQGCPLSPQLFNIAISPLLFALRRLQDSGVQLSGDDRPGASAYADDLKIFSGTKEGVTQQHELVADFLRWTGMAANPAKCSSMGVRRNGHGASEADNLELELDGTPIPTMTQTQSYQYLGIGDGFDHVRRRVELAPALKLLKQDATALLESGLAPWQVVKAVKVYLFPRVEYALRHLRPEDQHLESFDLHLRRGLRHLLRLPKNANNHFFYAPVSRGGLGLLPLVELHASLQIAHGWQMLNSPDQAIRRIARVQLHQIADARHRLDKPHWKERGDELCELFLNWDLGMSTHAPPKRRNGDIGSLWVDIRKNLKAFGLKVATAPADPETGAPAQPLQLRVPHHAEWLDHRNVLRHVKQHIKNKHWRDWCAFGDQGKTARVHGGAGSCFLTQPRGMWESDYRFAVAARLNLVDTADALSRRRLRAHDRCRHPGCRWKESLAHVLNHCPGTMDAARGRHDDALKEIEHTLRASSGARRELRVNQTVPGLPGPALRPDLQVYNHEQRTVAVVDLAVAFDKQETDDPESSGLAKAIADKKSKYAGIKQHLERQGWTVHLSALVYGSLGSVAPSNHKVYTEHLGLLKRDATRLDRQLSVACIQSSRRIWNLHCAKHRARQHQPASQAPRGSRVTETGGTPSRTGRR